MNLDLVGQVDMMYIYYISLHGQSFQSRTCILVYPTGTEFTPFCNIWLTVTVSPGMSPDLVQLMEQADSLQGINNRTDPRPPPPPPHTLITAHTVHTLTHTHTHSHSHSHALTLSQSHT